MENTVENKESLEKIMSEKLGNPITIVTEEDTFDFKCQRCGQCCMHRNDIVLSPHDIYDASKYLGIMPLQFLEEYTNTHIGHTSSLPVITLAVDDRGWCPFLQFDIKAGGLFGCSINDAKPGACRNHPIGIATSFKSIDENSKVQEAREYYIKVEQCKNSQGHNNIVKVADWIKKSKECSEERMWSHTLQTIPPSILDMKKFIILIGIQTELPSNFDELPDGENKEAIKLVVNRAKDIIATLIEAIVDYTYLNYSIDRPFCEQAEENANKLKEICLKCKAYYDLCCEAFVESGGDIDALFDTKGE